MSECPLRSVYRQGVYPRANPDRSKLRFRSHRRIYYIAGSYSPRRSVITLEKCHV